MIKHMLEVRTVITGSSIRGKVIYKAICGYETESPDGVMALEGQDVTCIDCTTIMDERHLKRPVTLPPGYELHSLHDLDVEGPDTPTGVWFVYGHDMMDYPLFVSDEEVVALRWVAQNVYRNPEIAFWEFGIEWDDFKRITAEKKAARAND